MTTAWITLKRYDDGQSAKVKASEIAAFWPNPDGGIDVVIQGSRLILSARNTMAEITSLLRDAGEDL